MFSLKKMEEDSAESIPPLKTTKPQHHILSHETSQPHTGQVIKCLMLARWRHNLILSSTGLDGPLLADCYF